MGLAQQPTRSAVKAVGSVSISPRVFHTRCVELTSLKRACSEWYGAQQQRSQSSDCSCTMKRWFPWASKTSYVLDCSKQPCDSASQNLTRCRIVKSSTVARMPAVALSMSFTLSPAVFVYASLAASGVMATPHDRHRRAHRLHGRHRRAHHWCRRHLRRRLNVDRHAGAVASRDRDAHELTTNIYLELLARGNAVGDLDSVHGFERAER